MGRRGSAEPAVSLGSLLILRTIIVSAVAVGVVIGAVISGSPIGTKISLLLRLLLLSMASNGTAVVYTRMRARIPSVRSHIWSSIILAAASSATDSLWSTRSSPCVTHYW